MQYIVLDLEATCWENVRTPLERSEVIEIGAVRLTDIASSLADRFGTFVRPVASPRLSAFCTQLTGITQEVVDGADYFWATYPRFLEWVGPEPWVFCSWGAYDAQQLRADCRRHRLDWPPTTQFINLKSAFGLHFSRRPVGMSKAMYILGMDMEGRHHSGYDDAYNIARIALHVLPKLNSSSYETLPG